MKRLFLLMLASVALAGCSNDTEVDASCMANLQCGAQAFKEKAEELCRPRIEKAAGGDLVWVRSRELELLSSFAWKNKAKGIIAYYGHKAKLETLPGQFVPEKYECDVDPKNKKAPVVDVQVETELSN